MRIPKGSTISIVTEPFDGTPSAATATVTRADGTVITPAPTCTLSGAAAVVPLAAADHLDELDTLEVVVTATVDSVPQVQVLEVDVVGSSWTTLAALRREPDLSSEQKYPDWLLRQVRDEWEAHIEDLCRTRFVPGYGIHLGYGNGLTTWTLPYNDLRALRLVRQNGTDVTADCTLDLSTGILEYRSGFDQTEPLEVHFEYGTTAPPARLVRELRKAVRSELVRRGATSPTDAIRETSPDGGVVIQYSTPDPKAGRHTGVMTLDAAIERYRRPALGIA